MQQITFEHIHKSGQVVLNNELFKHFHFQEVLLMYNGNFIEFKRVPTLEEFIQTKNYLQDFHQNKGQYHLKFNWPPSHKITNEILRYLKEEEFDFSFIELYAIDPKNFPKVESHPDIKIVAVSEETLEDYLALQYEFDLTYGADYADQKVKVHKSHFQNSNYLQILAYYKGVPAGLVDVIISENTAEIDGLEVKEEFRNKGIAKRIQRFVMDQYLDKTVILVADGEDTPREMYQKQNYQLMGFQYEILKILPKL
jgi:ribosomal protein S18 acetylase RimI-like enzyme